MPLGISYDAWTEWSPLARGYALAWTRNKKSICPGCRTRADEWDENEHAYYSDQIYCEGCARLADEQNNIRRDADGRPRPGFHVFLRPDMPPRPEEAHLDDE